MEKNKLENKMTYNEEYLWSRRVKRALRRCKSPTLDETIAEVNAYNKEHGKSISYGKYMLMKQTIVDK